MLHLRGLVTDEAHVSTDQGLNHRLPWALVWSLRSVNGEPRGQGGEFQCSPQDLKLTWPSDHPSFYRDFGTDKVMIHLQTRSLKPGRRANGQHTPRARRNFLSWSHSSRQGDGGPEAAQNHGDIPGWEQQAPHVSYLFGSGFPAVRLLLNLGLPCVKDSLNFVCSAM